MSDFEEKGVLGVTPGMDLAKADAGGFGLGSDYIGFRNTMWGQPQPVSYDLLWRMYREDPIITGCIELIANNIIGDGWDIVEGDAITVAGRDVDMTANTDEQQSGVLKVREVFDRSEFNVFLRDIIVQLLVYGDAYAELVRNPDDWSVVGPGGRPQGTGDTEVPGRNSINKPKTKGLMPLEDDIPLDKASTLAKELVEVGELEKANTAEMFQKLLDKYSQRLDGLTPPKGEVVSFFPRDAKTIRIDYNEHNEVVKYIQRVLHRRVDFWPEEMIHFTLNRVGNRPYGKGPLTSLLYTFQAKQQAEKYTSDYFRRGFMPRLLYAAKNFSKDQQDRLKANLKALQPQEDIVLFGEVDVKEVAPTNQDMQFKDLLAYMKQNIYIALQVPPVLIGDSALGSSGGRNTSQVQLDSFYKYIKSMKNDIAENINRKLLTKENFGVDNLRFVFKEDNTKEELRRAQQAQLYTAIPYVTPNEVRETLHMPPLEGEHEEVGKTPIFVIQQQQQMAMAEHAAALAPKVGPDGKPKPGGSSHPGGIKNPNAANPAASVTRTDNAEANNSEQQKDTKKSLQFPIHGPEDWDAIAKCQHPNCLDLKSSLTAEYMSHVGKVDKSVSMAADVAYDREKNEQSALQHAGKVQQATQVVIPDKQSYPFGAVQTDDRDRKDNAVYQTVRGREIESVVENTPDNSFSLNTNRQWPKDAGMSLRDGVTPVVAGDGKREFPGSNAVERDEVNQAGRRVWAAPDSKKSVTATFYKGMTQLDEIEKEKKGKKH